MAAMLAKLLCVSCLAHAGGFAQGSALSFSHHQSWIRSLPKRSITRTPPRLPAFKVASGREARQLNSNLKAQLQPEDLDFSSLHEMVFDSSDGWDMIANEFQSVYKPSVCKDGTAEYLRQQALLSEDDTLRWIRSHTVKTLSAEEASMQVYPEQGQWLKSMMRAIRARFVLEVGTFTGYSSTCIASSLPADGKLVCLDVSEKYTSIAREAWGRAGLQERIELRLGPGLAEMERMIRDGEGGFDAIFIDADKESYDEYYEAALLLLREGGVVLLDDALWSGRVVGEADAVDEETRSIILLNDKMARDPRVSFILDPIADGVAMAVKKERASSSKSSDEAAIHWEEDMSQSGARSTLRDTSGGARQLSGKEAAQGILEEAARLVEEWERVEEGTVDGRSRAGERMGNMMTMISRLADCSNVDVSYPRQQSAFQDVQPGKHHGLHLSLEGNFGVGTSLLSDQLLRCLQAAPTTLPPPCCSVPSWLTSSFLQDYSKYAMSASIAAIQASRLSAQLVRDFQSHGRSFVVDSSTFSSSAFLRANARHAILPSELSLDGVEGEYPGADVLVFLFAPPSLCMRRIEEEGVKVCEKARRMIEQLDEELFKNLLLLLLQPDRHTQPLVIDWREKGSASDVLAMATAAVAGNIRLPRVTVSSRVPLDVDEHRVVSLDDLYEFAQAMEEGDENVFESDPRATPGSFLKVTSSLLQGGSALGLEASLVPEEDNTIYIEDPYALGEEEEEEEGGAPESDMSKIRATYRQCVLFLLARLKDVVLIRD